MAIITTKQRVHNALSLKNETNIYVAIGGTSVWADEANPSAPSVAATTVTELIYIKKVTLKHMVEETDVYDPYSTPDVTVDGIDYTYIDDSIVYSQSAKKIYLSATINFGDIAPTDTTFRIVGLCINPTDDSNVILTGTEYLAADVGSVGELLWLDNIVAVTRDLSQQEKFEIVINF